MSMTPTDYSWQELRTDFATLPHDDCAILDLVKILWPSLRSGLRTGVFGWDVETNITQTCNSFTSQTY